jgi:hypothetical protein
MKPLGCAAAKRLLHAYHDGELQVGDQIGVAGHLAWCETCAAAFADFQLLRAALRTTACGRGTVSDEEQASLRVAVVSRVRAERSAALSVCLREAFEDMHLVYTGLGASLASFVCVVSVLAMMHFATDMRPDSLAALVNLIGATGSAQTPEPPPVHLLMPRALDAGFSLAADSSVGGEYMLEGVVTREGRVVNLELLHAASGRPVATGTPEALAAQHLMGAVAKTRFEPARVDGLPVAVNMMWPVTDASVRNSKPSLDRRPPSAKRRTA